MTTEINNTNEIVTIPDEYKRAGFIHRLVKRGEFSFVFAIYENETATVPLFWEVFKKLVSKAGMARFGGGPEKWVPSKERRPNDESFGKWAWSLPTEDRALRYFKALEELKGDLKAFWEFRSPNPILKVFELHDANGKPLSMKIMGKPTNRIVKIGAEDMEAAKVQAKDAFAKMLGSAFDIRGYSPVFIGEERMYGKSDDEELELEGEEAEDND